ncbi:MAG: DUF58 domain-containing protein [bacterium]|nr:DUF58 domain-containing protein [bacterium]
MIPREILKKVKNIEIKTRQIVNSTFTGSYHSAFKGRGISFSEVREYQPGDEIRQIDWHVTAKMNHPYIKLFEEERELTVILMVDLSASGDFGSFNISKANLASEIAAILGFSANNNNDRVGLILFSDKVEKFVPPKKGKNHMFAILREIFYYKPDSKKTSISNALDFMLKTNKKKSIVFLISDFIDSNYEKKMSIASRKHDMVPIIIRDPKEENLPKAGLLNIEDSETGEILTINTRSVSIRQSFQNIIFARHTELIRFFKSINIKHINLNTEKPYVRALIDYFKYRADRY